MKNKKGMFKKKKTKNKMKTFIFYFSRECPRPPLPRDDPRGGSSACTFQIFKIHFL